MKKRKIAKKPTKASRVRKKTPARKGRASPRKNGHHKKDETPDLKSLSVEELGARKAKLKEKIAKLRADLAMSGQPAGKQNGGQ